MSITKVLEATSFHKFSIIELNIVLFCGLFYIYSSSFFSIFHFIFEFHTSRTVTSCSLIFYGWNLFSYTLWMNMRYEKKSSELYFLRVDKGMCKRTQKKHLGKKFKFLSSCAWCGTHSGNKQLRKWNILLVINEKNASQNSHRLLVPL
jgi:hypothetical protein